MSNNNPIDLTQFGFGKLVDHTEQTIQSPYTRNVWLSFLPPDLHQKLHLIQAESDEDMLMRRYLYNANSWMPFVVGYNEVQCRNDLANKLRNILKSAEEVEQWQAAVREALDHMEECFNSNRLTKLKKLSKDWRGSVFVGTKTKVAA